MRSLPITLAVAALVGLAGCEADEETFEAGADMQAPPLVEDAPLTDPVPPTNLEDAAEDVIAADTLEQLEVEPSAPVDTAP